MGLLDRPDAGRITIDGVSVNELRDDHIAARADSSLLPMRIRAAEDVRFAKSSATVRFPEARRLPSGCAELTMTEKGGGRNIYRTESAPVPF